MSETKQAFSNLLAAAERAAVLLDEWDNQGESIDGGVSFIGREVIALRAAIAKAKGE